MPYAAPEPYLTSREDAAAFWKLGSLWSVLASAESTGGAFTVLDQLMPRLSGPPLHLHPRWHELFSVLDGDIRFQVGDEVLEAHTGAFLSIPPGTPHAFAVLTETARVLNVYTPGGFDEQITMTGEPATARTLPPDGLPPFGSPEQQAAFTRRSVELNSQAPVTDLTDRLADVRPWPPRH